MKVTDGSKAEIIGGEGTIVFNKGGGARADFNTLSPVMDHGKGNFGVWANIDFRDADMRGFSDGVVSEATGNNV